MVLVLAAGEVRAANYYVNESKTMVADWTVTDDALSIAYNTSTSEPIVLDVGSWYLTVNGNLIVGHNRLGTLNLGTGNVSVLPQSKNVGTYIGNDSGSVGIVNVDGGTFTAGGVKPFYIGRTGKGELNLNSGSVVSTNEVYIGYNQGGNGTVNINGGTFTAKKHLYVGDSGTGTLNLNGGTLTVANDFNIANGSGSTGVFKGTSGTLSLTGSWNVFNVGYGQNSTGSVTKDGGDWSCYYLRLGNNSGATGTFTHNDGTLEIKTELSIGSTGTGTFTMDGGIVTLNSTASQFIGKNSGSSGTLELNGGIFTARCLRRNDDKATATLNFNGGTLKANYSDTRGLIASGVSVNVLAGGGTIDSGNNSVDVAAALSGEGAMTFKGGSAITLSGANTYTGGTTIELGTKVVAGTEEAKAAVLENGLVVDGRTVLTATDYTVFEYPIGGLTDDAINNISYENCADGTVANVVDGSKIVVTLAEATCVPKTPSTLKVFEDKTLDDIVYGKFSARMCGAYVGDAFDVRDAAKGYNKKLYYENGNLTKIIVEFQVRDGSNTKCVVVEFTEEGGSVYAKGLGAKYSSNAIGYEFYDQNGTWHGSDPNSIIDKCYAEAIAADGYGVCDIRVTIEEATEWTLEQNMTWSKLRAGATLDGDSLVRIIVTGDSPTLTIDEDVDVAKIEFVNGCAGGISTTSLAVFDGVTVACGMVELGDNVCVKPIAFTPASVTLLGGSSRLLYDAGESVCAAEVSGKGYIEVALGATLYVDGDVGAAYILNKGTVVKTGEGTVAWPFNNASTGVTIVRNGTLKVASCIGNGMSQTVRVASGATLDMNGVKKFCPAVMLENGACLVNTGAAIDANTMQMVGLTLEGDASVIASGNFGLLAPDYCSSSLHLNSHILTLNGSAVFWICNTEIDGDGTMVLNSRVECIYSNKGNDNGGECTMNVGESGALRINNEVSLKVKNFHNGGTVTAPFKEGNKWYAGGTLVVTGTLTSGNSIPKLTLTAGSSVKASAATPQAVTSEFSASGMITIDASTITVSDFRNATDRRIAVLRVPAEFDHSQVKWEVSRLDAIACSLRWEMNDDGKTKTLYLCRSSGMMIVVR